MSRFGSSRAIALHLGLLVLFLVALLGARSGGLSIYFSTLAADSAMFAIALMGLSVLYGWSGQISLGHAAFMGIGAYATALANPHTNGLPLSWLIDLIAAVMAGAIIGLLVGLPSLRISGLQLVVITLGFAQVFQWVLNNFEGVSGGTQGLLLEHTTVGPFDFGVPDERFIVTFVLAGLAGLFYQLFARSTVARSMLAVRESEQAASSVGIRPATPKLAAFVISAVLAAVAGWVFAYGSLIVIPGTFSLFDNVFLLVAVIIGGRSSLAGVWIGALFLVLVPEFSRNVADGALYPVIAGIVLLAVMLIAPRGLSVGIGSLLRGRRGPNDPFARVRPPGHVTDEDSVETQS